MKFLALDMGEKRIGLATSQGLKLGVWPQKTLIRRNLEEDFQSILNFIEEHEVGGLVVGLPKNMDGSEGDQVQRVKIFIKKLEQFLGHHRKLLPIAWCDERLTSWEASQRLSERGVKGKKKKDQMDSFAACLILEDFLKLKG